MKIEHLNKVQMPDIPFSNSLHDDGTPKRLFISRDCYQTFHVVGCRKEITELKEWLNRNNINPVWLSRHMGDERGDMHWLIFDTDSGGMQEVIMFKLAWT